MAKRASKFQYGRSEDGLWYWRLKAGNGEIIAHGEGYKRELGCLNGIASVRASVSSAPLVLLKSKMQSTAKKVGRKTPHAGL